MRNKENNVRQLERGVMGLKEWVAGEAHVREEVVEGVVEVEVEQMVEDEVGGEVQEKVVQEKVTGAG